MPFNAIAIRAARAALAAGSVAVLALAAGCDSSEPAGRSATVLTTTPTVTVATVNGTGCPAGSATPVVAVDGSSITVVYTAFTAKAGAGSTPTEFRRNCQLSVKVVSPGQTFAVASVTEHGAVDIPTGGTALQRTNYYLQGNAVGTPVDHSAAGPLSGAWDQSDPAPFSAPCGTTKNLNVNVELRVSSPGPAASLSLNGSSPGTTINLSYTSCP